MNVSRITALIIVLATFLFGTGCALDTGDHEAFDAAESYATETCEPGYFELFQGRDGQWYFNLKSANHETVLRSEGYTRKASAENGIASVENNGTDIASFRIKEAKNGSYYFNLRARNHQVIGTSELYNTKYNAERGARGVADLLVRMLDCADAQAAE